MDNRLVSLRIIKVWAAKAVHHMEQCEKWETAFNKRKAKIERTPVYMNAVESEQRKFMEMNWDLKDYTAKHNWHTAQANRLHTAILAQHALREMMKDEQW